jgi:hypothetical protein
MSFKDTFIKDPDSEVEAHTDVAAYREQVIKAVDMCLAKDESKDICGMLIVSQDVGEGYEMISMSLNASPVDMVQMMQRTFAQLKQTFEDTAEDRVLN